MAAFSSALVFNIYQACENADLNELKRFLDEGKDVNQKFTKLSKTALHEAVNTDFRSGIELLVIKHQANIDAQDAHGDTPLHYAVFKKSPEVVKFLLKYGLANPNIKNKKGDTPLMKAIEYFNDKNDAKSISIIQLLITNPQLTKAINIDDKNNARYTALHLAVKKKQLELVKYLFLKYPGISIYEENYYQNTPMMIAAELGHLKILKFFIEKGVDINITNRHGTSLLHIAVKYHNFPNNNFKVIKYLIKKSIDVNLRESFFPGYSPLHLAILSDRPDLRIIGKLLSLKKLNVNILDAEDKTALIHLCEKKNLYLSSPSLANDILNLLLEHEYINIDNQDIVKRTALHHAAGNGSFLLVDTLLSSGKCNPNFIDRDGNDPLNLAIAVTIVEGETMSEEIKFRYNEIIKRIRRYKSWVGDVEERLTDDPWAASSYFNREEPLPTSAKFLSDD